MALSCLFDNALALAGGVVDKKDDVGVCWSLVACLCLGGGGENKKGDEEVDGVKLLRDLMVVNFFCNSFNLFLSFMDGLEDLRILFLTVSNFFSNKGICDGGAAISGS